MNAQLLTDVVLSSFVRHHTPHVSILSHPDAGLQVYMYLTSGGHMRDQEAAVQHMHFKREAAPFQY